MPDANAMTLTKVTAGYGRTTVLREVDLVVPEGQVVALLGPNGAGKTTLLKVAAGFLAPSSGTIDLRGATAPRRPNGRAREGLCHIPEGRGVFGRLTVAENLRLQLPPWAKGGTIEPALEAFPVLKERLSQTAGTMSGGQQQMLALSRCFLAEPRVVLLDEVSMGLAPIVVDEIFEALRKLAQSGVALLLVEQYVAKALALSDRVVVLDRGRVALQGTPDEIDAETLHRQYLGTAAATAG